MEQRHSKVDGIIHCRDSCAKSTRKDRRCPSHPRQGWDEVIRRLIESVIIGWYVIRRCKTRWHGATYVGFAVRLRLLDNQLFGWSVKESKKFFHSLWIEGRTALCQLSAVKPVGALPPPTPFHLLPLKIREQLPNAGQRRHNYCSGRKV